MIRNFMIINTVDINQINFDEVLETSQNTLRYSLDGTKTFIKWEGKNIPNSIQQISNTEGPYSHQQFIKILSNSFWVNDIEI